MWFVKSFITLLLINFAWESEARSYNSDGYPYINDAQRNCWPHDIQARGGRYFCQTFQQTVLNKYIENFGYEASKVYENNDKFNELIKFVDDNGFCGTRVLYRIQRLYPDYKKYLNLGQKIRQFSRLYGYCASKIRSKTN